MEAIPTKECSYCHRVKFIFDFYPKRDSFTSRCKRCILDKQNARKRSLRSRKVITHPVYLETKRCTNCGEVKPIISFRFMEKKGRYIAKCRACLRERKVIHSRRINLYPDDKEKSELARLMNEED